MGRKRGAEAPPASDPISLSGTSGTPNAQATDLAGGRTANASWEFRNDGTVWYSINGVFTQYADAIEWNGNQDSPTAEYWIRFTVDSGDSPSSGTIGSWLKVSGSGSVTRNFVYEQAAVGTLAGTIQVDISDVSDGSNIIETGYYRAVAQRAI